MANKVYKTNEMEMDFKLIQVKMLVKVAGKM